ncbi:MAG: MBL fold metallo-hydrolase [Cyclobacteriaceae bacterium]|nr:MBL fold metallo-hydrolase [Cyclobacteriaceae bacterium]
MTIQSFVFNPFSENTYVASDETKEAVIIDPGCYEPTEQAELDRFIISKGLTVKFVLNTHCHIDHVLGNFHCKAKYKVPLLLHKQDEKVLLAVQSYASNYGFAGYQPTLPDRFLEENEPFAFGNTKWKVLFLPGHSPGHIAFYDEPEKTIFSGDVLFKRSIGRTDLLGGNFDVLLKSIQQKLFLLPDDVVVYSGHGPTTTIGEEKKSNPFCALTNQA